MGRVWSKAAHPSVDSTSVKSKTSKLRKRTRPSTLNSQTLNLQTPPKTRNPINSQTPPKKKTKPSKLSKPRPRTPDSQRCLETWRWPKDGRASRRGHEPEKCRLGNLDLNRTLWARVGFLKSTTARATKARGTV